MNFLPTHHVLPRAQPFSRENTYVDLIGPPPVEFFDRTQDHLAQYVHARTGWKWSCEQEEFTTTLFPSNTKMASFTIVRNDVLGGGLAISNMTTGVQGEHGVVRGAAISAIMPYFFEAQTGCWRVGTEDFLVTFKVYCVRRSVIDQVVDGGFWIGCGPPIGADGNAYPAIVGGSGLANWYIRTATDTSIVRFYDTGIPFLTSEEMPDQTRRAWNTLQICRINGTLRFYINSALARLTGFGLTNSEGVRFTASLRDMRGYFKTQRSGGGLTSDGFYMDYFSRWARRST